MNLTVKSLCVIALLSIIGVAGVNAQPGRGPAGPPVQSPGYGAPQGRGYSAPQGMPGSSYGAPSNSYRGQMQRSGNAEPTRFGSAPSSTSYPSYSRSDSRSYSPPAQGPTLNRSGAPGSSVPADTAGMQQALTQQDYDRIREETQGVRSRTKDIQEIGPQLPAGDRMKLPLIGHMYRQGADIIDEGRDSKDPSKIKMGIQQINDANEKMRVLENSKLKGDKEKSGRGQGRSSR